MNYAQWNSGLNQSRKMITNFGGYNHNITCGENEFFEADNITNDLYPMLSSRKRRGVFLSNEFKSKYKFVSFIDSDFLYGLWQVKDDNKYLIVDHSKEEKNDDFVLISGIELGDEFPKRLIKFNAYGIILPDKKYVVLDKDEIVENDSYGEIETRISTDGYETPKKLTFSLCDENYVDIDYSMPSENVENPTDDSYKMTKTKQSDGHHIYSLERYSESLSAWIPITATTVKISGLFNKDEICSFKAGDGVKISVKDGDMDDSPFWQMLANEEENGKRFGYFDIVKVDEKTEEETKVKTWDIYISAFLGNNGSEDKMIREYNDEDNYIFEMSREMPDMEYMVSCNNRLWGCSKDGHTLYASKLGDFRNWLYYKGSMASWYADVGTPGKWTGAINYLGYPIFFKRNSMTRVYISNTGAHQTKDTDIRGVAEGCSDSLVQLNECLYYKSEQGICAYSGSLPYSISDNLGELYLDNVKAGSVGDKYYIFGITQNGDKNFFIYDTKKGLWNKESCKNDVVGLATDKTELYFADSKSNLYSVKGITANEKESAVDWSCESGIMGLSIPDNKYASRLDIRVQLSENAEFELYIQYDSDGLWQKKFGTIGRTLKAYTIPITLHRCDHYKIKMCGKGEFKLISLTQIIEQGSEL